MLEKSLLNNPTFTEHELVKTSIPFLYSKDSDIIIRTGDIHIGRGKPYEIISLNFKRREFTSKSLCETRNAKGEDNTTRLHGIKDDNTFAHFPQPDKVERKFLSAIHTKEFYRHSNRELQKKHYHTHLRCAVYNGFHPPFFASSGEGMLVIEEARYWNYFHNDPSKTFNPFSDVDISVMRSLANNGIETSIQYKLEDFSLFFSFCIPELSYLLYEAIPQEEELDALSA